MNLQTYLMIKHAGGNVVNNFLKKRWKAGLPTNSFNMGAGYTYAAMKAGATPKQMIRASKGVSRRYDPNGLEQFGGGMSYPTFQQGLAEEMGRFDPRSIGLSEGRFGKVLRDDKLRRIAYNQAPNVTMRGY